MENSSSSTSTKEVTQITFTLDASSPCYTALMAIFKCNVGLQVQTKTMEVPNFSPAEIWEPKASNLTTGPPPENNKEEESKPEIQVLQVSQGTPPENN